VSQKKATSAGGETQGRRQPTKRQTARSASNETTPQAAGRATRKRQPRAGAHPKGRHVSDVMTRAVLFMHPEDTLQEAARKMKDLNVGPLPVCDGARLVGIVTDRDIAVRGVAEGRDPRGTRIREVMSADVITCRPEQDVAEAARLMREKQVRRLVVLDQDDHLAGIVSLGDLAVEGGDQRLSGKTLEAVSRPTSGEAGDGAGAE
jgi:CBS domain-containing protein